MFTLYDESIFADVTTLTLRLFSGVIFIRCEYQYISKLKIYLVRYIYSIRLALNKYSDIQ